MYSGSALKLKQLDNNIIELCFDREDGSQNSLNQALFTDLQEALKTLKGVSFDGILMTSAKSMFIVGADIFEFSDAFARSEQGIIDYFSGGSQAMCELENLPVPIVVAINGMALGGGLEFALLGDARVIGSDAAVGLPEVNLGLFPGLGGTCRLPRLTGLTEAMNWIVDGKPRKADKAQEVGVADKVVDPAQLRKGALAILQELMASGEWKTLREKRRGPIPVDTAAVKSVQGALEPMAKHFPAAFTAVNLMEKSAATDLYTALDMEAKAFPKIAKSQTATAMVGNFVNDQFIKKKNKSYAKQGIDINQAAVLGAGIMGGGIAYTSAVRGTPVIMKDIADAALDLGIGEAKKLLNKQVSTGRMDQAKADAVLGAITPVLEYTGFDKVDVVIEAVVENLKIKKSVLKEVESLSPERTILASNTSSLLITEMATALDRPEQFVGMHFFNPVHAMPLVEVISGEKTSEQAANTIAAYAVAMGKTPILVKDCPGFLVNRILTTYMTGALQLIAEGADFMHVDRVMEDFGWPMGPFFLNDVIGIDTGSHVFDIISAGYPSRIQLPENNAVKAMLDNKRFGQKNGIGFYSYIPNEKGRPVKTASEDSYDLIRATQASGQKDFSAQEIVDRCMLPMLVEAAICLEEGVAASPAEIDTALLLGLNFPRQVGGALRYADWIGLDTVIERCDKYEQLRHLPTDALRKMAADGKSFY